MSSFKPCRFNAYFHAICATAITLAFAVSGRTVLAVDGDLDLTFGTDGKVLTDFDHSTDIADAVAIQADGKLVVVGTTYRDNDFSNEDFAVARYNSDGTLDKTFGAGGKVQVSKRPASSCSLTLHWPATSTPRVFHCRRRLPLQHQRQL